MIYNIANVYILKLSLPSMRPSCCENLGKGAVAADKPRAANQGAQDEQGSNETGA